MQKEASSKQFGAKVNIKSNECPILACESPEKMAIPYPVMVCKRIVHAYISGGSGDIFLIHITIHEFHRRSK